MTQSHTPAPWQAQKRLNCGNNIIVKAGETDVAAVFTPPWGYDAPKSNDEAKANARLIAASPCLLSACKAAQDAIENATDDLDRESPEYLTLCAVLVQLETAIAEAEGKA